MYNPIHSESELHIHQYQLIVIDLQKIVFHCLTRNVAQKLIKARFLHQTFNPILNDIQLYLKGQHQFELVNGSKFEPGFTLGIRKDNVNEDSNVGMEVASLIDYQLTTELE